MQKPHILKKAILSEKAYKLMEQGVYTFLVDSNSNKDQIASFIKNQFNVKVKKVNISLFSQKQKRIANSRKFVSVGGGKKAIVYLEAGQSIPLLSPKSDTKKESKKNKELKKNEKETK